VNEIDNIVITDVNQTCLVSIEKGNDKIIVDKERVEVCWLGNNLHIKINKLDGNDNKISVHVDKDGIPTFSD